MFSNGDALRTILLAFPALLTLGRKSRASGQHASLDDVVIDAGNVWGIEHATLVIHFKTFWNADIGWTWHAVSASCTGDFDAFLVLGFCFSE